jgi:AcrR family transcriptional regulator
MSPTRRELVRATRARIVEAAGRLTRERGAAGFSMDVLAKEAGVARATVYEHFRSKRAVLDELANSIARSVTMEESRTAIGDPLVALRDMLTAVCHHWAEQEERMKGLRTLTALTGGEPAGDGIEEGQVRRLVEALEGSGQMRGHWTVDEATDALGALTSYATYERLRRAGRSADDIEAILAKLVVSIVSRGANQPVASGVGA